MNVETTQSVLIGSVWNWNRTTPLQDSLDQIRFKPRRRGRLYEGGGQRLSFKARFTYRLLGPETLKIRFYRTEEPSWGLVFIPVEEPMVREHRFQLVPGPHEQKEQWGPTTTIWRYQWRLVFDDDLFPEPHSPPEYFGWALPTG